MTAIVMVSRKNGAIMTVKATIEEDHKRVARCMANDIVTGRKVEYIDDATGERWVMDYPQSELHGGGPPRLRPR